MAVDLDALVGNTINLVGNVLSPSPKVSITVYDPKTIDVNFEDDPEENATGVTIDAAFAALTAEQRKNPQFEKVDFNFYIQSSLLGNSLSDAATIKWDGVYYDVIVINHYGQALYEVGVYKA